MKKLVLVVLTLFAMPAFAQEIPLDPAFQTGQLDNGMTWYVRENTEPEERAFLNLVVNVGSLQEDEDQQGLAHFLEHMAFNGTENFEKQELIDYLEKIGMEFGPEINAYTSFDETVYMLTIPTDDSEFLEQGFQILSDWSRRILLTEEDVVDERGVVLDEWRRRLGAGQRINEEERKLYYYGSRYAERFPIGQPEIIETATPEPMRRFYEDYYRPDLMAIVAVGDFESERILELIHEHFDEDWGPDMPRELILSEVEPHDETLYSFLADPELTRSSAEILLKFEQPPVRTMEDYRHATVSSLVRGLFSSRMRELQNRNEAEFAFAWLGARRLSPNWRGWTLAVTAADGELEPAMAQALTEWKRIREHGFTQTELDRQKVSMLRQAETRFKDRENQRSGMLARRMTSVFQGRSILPGPEWTLETYQELLPTIELSELQAVVDEVDFERTDSRLVMTNSPEREGLPLPTREEMEGALATAAAAAVQPWVDTTREEPLITALPEPGRIVDEQYDEDLELTTWTLSNGVTVLVKPTDFNEDTFQFSSFSPGGSSLGASPQEISESLAAFFVDAGGVGEFDAIELQKWLTGKIARSRATIGQFEEGFSGSGSPDDLETVLQLVYLQATAPRRDEAAFDGVIERFSTYFENRSLDPNQVYSDSLTVILFDNHPDAQPLTADELRSADLDRAFAFYEDRFEDLDDLVMVFVGALDIDALRPLAEQYLATLPATDREETWRDNGMRMIDGPLHRAVEVGMDEKASTTLIMHGEADWDRMSRYSMGALASALDIRLREVLREDLSGTYGVSVRGRVSAWPEPRWQLTISFGCEPARLDELVGQAVAVLEEVRDGGFDPDYLEKVREQDLRSNEENVRTNGYWASVLEFRAQYGIDQREELATREFIEAFTQDDLDGAARRHIRTDELIRIDKVPATES
jgi:zinc protease